MPPPTVTQNVALNFLTSNVSAQVGDVLYRTTTSPQGGFDQGEMLNTRRLGSILSIAPGLVEVVNEDDDIPSTFYEDGTITVVYEHIGFGSLPDVDDFISFAKDKRVNTSSLLGYYASVNFVNNSTDKVELFSIGSEVSESSK